MLIVRPVKQKKLYKSLIYRAFLERKLTYQYNG